MKKIIAVDLDDTLCFRTSEEGGVEKYKSCVPNEEMVKIINSCYDKGHEIIIFSARGMCWFTGNLHVIQDELYELTKNQLRTWGVKHHRLVLGKIHYDVLIDDKVMNSRFVNSRQDIEDFLTNEIKG